MSRKFSSVDQALSAITLEGTSIQAGQQDAVLREVRNAAKPVLSCLWEGEVAEELRDRAVTAFIDNTIPSMLKTFSRHLNVKAA